MLVWPPVPARAALQQLCSGPELSDQRGQKASSPCLCQRYPAVCQKLTGTGQSVDLGQHLWIVKVSLAGLGIARLHRHAPQLIPYNVVRVGTTGVVQVLRREPPIPVPSEGIGLSLCEIDATAALVGPEHRYAAFDLRQPRSMFGLGLLRGSASRESELLFPRRPIQDRYSSLTSAGSRLRAFIRSRT